MCPPRVLLMLLPLFIGGIGFVRVPLERVLIPHVLQGPLMMLMEGILSMLGVPLLQVCVLPAVQMAITVHIVMQQVSLARGGDLTLGWVGVVVKMVMDSIDMMISVGELVTLVVGVRLDVLPPVRAGNSLSLLNLLLQMMLAESSGFSCADTAIVVAIYRFLVKVDVGAVGQLGLVQFPVPWPVAPIDAAESQVVLALWTTVVSAAPWVDFWVLHTRAHTGVHHA